MIEDSDRGELGEGGGVDDIAIILKVKKVKLGTQEVGDQAHEGIEVT